MIIRYLTPGDVAEHDKVTSQAFSYSCDIRDPASVLPCENVLGAFDDDDRTLLADLEIHKRKCHYGGELLTCAAVGGVAAKPEHRGKGAVKALFRRLFAESDCDISILYPFSEPYYRNLGYERAGYTISAAVPFAALSQISRNTAVTLYEGHNTEQLLALYNRCAQRYGLSFVRENAQAFSDRPYLSQNYTYIWKNNALATISVDRGKSVLFVHELWYDSCEAMLGILGFLRNFESNQKTVCFQKLPEGSPLLRYVQDLKQCELKMTDVGSVRILNVENVLKAHRYPVHNGSFTLQIGGERFRVAVSQNGVETQKDSASEPDAVMDIHTASQLLLCGFSDAAYVPGLVIRNPDSDFFKLFPPEPVFFTDGF